MDLEQQIPELARVEELAAVHNTIGICIPLQFDHETAVSLADRFADEPYFFLLESAAVGSSATFSRYSFMGFDQIWTYSLDSNGKTSVNGLSKSPGNAPNPIKAIEQLMAEHSSAVAFAKEVPDQVVAGFVPGGSVGYFGYDTAASLEPSIGKPPPHTLGLPVSHFFLPKNYFVVDHLTSRLYVTRYFMVDIGREPLQKTYDREVSGLRQLVKRLHGLHSPPPLKIEHRPVDFDSFEGSIAKSDFLKAAERCLEEIRSGEIFQIQIGNRLSRTIDARPIDVFRHLRILNPSPYMFFYKFQEHHILGASPEVMVGVSEKTMIHRPIAGTRKRTWQADKDDLMQKELVESEKERAEHVMLVDLSRNDIGRIAAPGTVVVKDLMVVEKYSHVFHMVSEVHGELAEGFNAYDAMVVSFPNGTVSGAPKIRAMQLIYEIEPVAREFYAGSLGMFGFDGSLKSTILIRSIHMADGRASTQASAGIVYDSIPEQEWLETKNKMMACLTAIQNTR